MWNQTEEPNFSARRRQTNQMTNYQTAKTHKFAKTFLGCVLRVVPAKGMLTDVNSDRILDFVSMAFLIRLWFFTTISRKKIL